MNATSVHEAPDSNIALVGIDQQVRTEYAPLGSEGDVEVGDQAEVYGWGATRTDKPEIECQSQLLKVAKVSVTSIDCPDGAAGVSVCANGKQVGAASTSDRQSYTAYINITSSATAFVDRRRRAVPGVPAESTVDAAGAFAWPGSRRE